MQQGNACPVQFSSVLNFKTEVELFK